MPLSRHSFAAFALYNESGDSMKGFLQKRWSFWLALFSCIAFLVGNMVGQHGWGAFWKSVWAKETEIHIVFEGAVSPLAQVPDPARWSPVTNHTVDFSAVPNEMLVPLPEYKASPHCDGAEQSYDQGVLSVVIHGKNTLIVTLLCTITMRRCFVLRQRNKHLIRHCGKINRMIGDRTPARRVRHLSERTHSTFEHDVNFRFLSPHGFPKCPPAVLPHHVPDEERDAGKERKPEGPALLQKPLHGVPRFVVECKCRKGMSTQWHICLLDYYTIFMIISKSSETINLASNSQIDTLRIGIALASTLYQNRTNVWFRGELGAGKTTFVQGLGVGLGLGEKMNSPTYAIENRYGEKFLHVDLYRLDAPEAQRMVEKSENFPSVRAIEWIERLEDERNKRNEKMRREEKQDSSYPLSPLILSSPSIIISISELSESKRSIEITFKDIPLPSRSDVEIWRKEVRLPQHIIRHCDAVAGMSAKLGAELLKRG